MYSPVVLATRTVLTLSLSLSLSLSLERTNERKKMRIYLKFQENVNIYDIHKCLPKTYNMYFYCSYKQCYM